MDLSAHDKILVNYVRNQDGKFLVVGDDQLFYRTLRGVVGKHLRLDDSCVAGADSFSKGLSQAAELAEASRLIVFVDRMVRGVHCAEFMRELRPTLPTVPVAAASGQLEREGLAYLFDLGVNTVITKPVSLDQLVAAVAGLLKPRTKVDQAILAGRSLLHAGNAQKALEIARLVEKTRPGHAGGLVLKGDALNALGDGEEARTAFEAAAAADPGMLEPFKRLADHHGASGDTERRLEVLVRLDELSPLNCFRKLAIGEIFVEQDDIETASGYFDGALREAVRQGLAGANEMASRMADMVGDKDPALAAKYLARLIETKGDLISESDLSTFNRLGLALRKLGRHEEALGYYEKALKIAQSDAGLLYNKGMAHAEGGDMRKAANCFDMAFKADKGLCALGANVCYNIGLIYHKLKREDDAVFYVRQAVEQYPDNHKAAKFLEKLTSAPGKGKAKRNKKGKIVLKF